MMIKDSVAIVTGASSGIGLATAKLLGKNGAKVVLAARSKEKLEKLSKEIPNSITISTDMTDLSQIKNLVNKTVGSFGRIDIFVNNAGQGYDAMIENIDPEKFRAVFELDLLAPTIAMKEVSKIMKKQKSGAIVNISSGTALMVLPSMGAYSSMKKALAQISLTAGQELKKYGICVSVVYPYLTDTDFEKNTLKDGEMEWEGGDRDIPPADSPNLVAEKIVEAIEKGKPEIFVHDWMGKRQ